MAMTDTAIYTKVRKTTLDTAFRYLERLSDDNPVPVFGAIIDAVFTIDYTSFKERGIPPDEAAAKAGFWINGYVAHLVQQECNRPAPGHLGPSTAVQHVLATNNELEQKLKAVTAALFLVHRGLKSGRIPDQSIIPPFDPDADEFEVVSLSTIINDALVTAGASP